jgi:hypothetical protein
MYGVEHTVYVAIPELKQYKDKTFCLYAGTAKEHALTSRPAEDVVEEIRQAKREGKEKFIFVGSSETLLMPLLKKIQIIVKLLEEIPGKDFIFHVCCAFDVDKEYERLCAEYGWTKKIGFISSNTFEYLTRNNVHYLNQVAPYDYEVIPNRPKLFVCFNKVHREHRIQLFVKMMNSGLIEKAHYSFEGSGEGWLDNIVNDPTFEPIVRDTFSKYRNLFPIRLNITQDRCNPIDLQPDDIKYHTESYFSIITETLFYNREESKKRHAFLDAAGGVFFSEKTFKTIGFKHPFILVGQYSILKELKKIGYKTFHPFIDESYDDIEDSDERMEAIWKEINRLCNFTPDQWVEWQNQIKPIVEYNYDVLKNKKSFLYSDLAKVHQLFLS